MSIIVVDENKCKKDSICVMECPVAGISQDGPDAFPKDGPNLAETCIRCGHCVAVCPHGALSHMDMSADDCPPIRKEFVTNTEQTEQFLRSRRSVRVFKDKSAPREVLEKLVDLAHYAPTAHNDQEVKWMIIEDKAEVKKLAEMVIDWMRSVMESDPTLARKLFFNMIVAAWDIGFDAVCRSAPHLVLAYAEDGTPFSSYYPMDCATALGYMELAAPSLGMGTCWNGMFMAAVSAWKPLREAINLPKNHRLNGVLMLGYPRFKYHRMPLRKEAPIQWGL